MTVSEISDNAKFISGIYSQPFIVRNDGKETVYLGQDSSLTVGSRSFTLAPGSSLNWGAGTELWAITDPGKSSRLEWMYDSNTSFTPGPSSVSINSLLTELASYEYSVPDTAVAFFSTITPLIDVSGYSSLYIDVNWGGGTGIPVQANYFQLNTFFANSIDGVTPDYVGLGKYRAEYLLLGCGGIIGENSLKVPVNAPYFQLEFNYSKLATVSTIAPFIIKIYGSTETINEAKYVHAGLGLSDDLAYGGVAEFRRSLIGIESKFITSTNKFVTASNVRLTNTLDTVFNCYTSRGGVTKYLFIERLSGTQPAAVKTPMALPMSPIRLELNNVVGAALPSIFTLSGV